MTPAIFLDRDGTIIELVHHLNNPDEVRLIGGAGQAIKLLADAGFDIVIVTNQSVIGRGKLTQAGLAEVHAEMNRQLAQYDAQIAKIYFCPVVPTQKDQTIIENTMRKPGPGMLLQAAQEHGLDLDQSWMVGDTVSDMAAGKNAGCQSILVRTGYGDRVADMSYVDAAVANLSEAATLILNEKEAP